MTRFLLKMLLMAALLAATVVLFALVPGRDTSFLAAFPDKHRALSEPGAGPRIILVGGSGLAFGIDSREIAEVFGRKTVNMGLSAGLPLQFILDETLPDLRAGDVVVLIPEYDFFFVQPPAIPEGRHLVPLLISCPEAIRHVKTPSQYLLLVRDLPLFLRVKEEDLERRVAAAFTGRPVTWEESGVYRRSSFDANGDVTAHLNQPPPGFKGGGWSFPEKLNRRAAGKINRFAALAARKGARVLFVYPAFSRIDFELVRERIAAVDTMLRSSLEVPILGTPAAFEMDDSLLYDSVYHLNVRISDHDDHPFRSMVTSCFGAWLPVISV